VILGALSLVPGTSTVWCAGCFGANDLNEGLPVIRGDRPALSVIDGPVRLSSFLLKMLTQGLDGERSAL
jgi:hypothetical protein